MAPFLAAAKLLYDGALVSERYAAVGEFIDAHPDAAIDPTVRPHHQRGARHPRAPAGARPPRGGPAARRRDGRARRRRRAGGADRSDAPAPRRGGRRPCRGQLADGHLHELLQSVRPVRGGRARRDGGRGAVRGHRAGPCVRRCRRTRHRRSGIGSRSATGCLAAGRRGRHSSWWCSARTCVAARWFTSSPTWAPGGLARSRRRRATGWRCCRPTPRQAGRSPGCPTVPRAPRCWRTGGCSPPRRSAGSSPRLPAPMQLGKVEFDDGTWRTAFGCDAAAATGADISEYGSWAAAIAAGAV